MMDNTTPSPSWYRVANLKPRLPSHVQIHRHHYRGEIWYVLQDHSAGRFQRFTPSAFRFIGLMDGQRTVQQLWELLLQEFGGDAPSQEEIIQLLGQLHAVDALQANVTPDVSELFKRFEKKEKMKWAQRLKSPLFLRFSLFDPEKFLDRFQGIATPLFRWPGAVIWLVVFSAGLFQVGTHWPELTQNITDKILAPKNLLILWATFPVLKIFHEFGHAFAVKVNGGEVHEVGIMFLVFTPIPYVDATSASAFRSKSSRMIVGAAGLLVELFVASLCVLLWVNIEPGQLRSVAYNTIFIAGVSSLLFNGNPLLRYDAYYILSDMLEIPNMGPRGIKYVYYLIQRYLFGVKNVPEPISTPGERCWFIVYTVTAFFYRMLVWTGIVMFVASKFFIIGLLFACWAMLNMFIFPVFKAIRFIAVSKVLRSHRIRAGFASVLLLGIFLASVTLVPIPLNTRTEGIVWIPERSFVRAEVDGFIEEILSEPGSHVSRNKPLIQCSDPLLDAEIQVLESRLEEAEAIFTRQVISDRVKADITKKEVALIKAQIEDARDKVDALCIHSPADGTFLVAMAQDLPGRFVRRGELVGYVFDRSKVDARVVVTQGDVDLVRQKTSGIHIRLPGKIGATLPAVLKREVPAATNQLPSRILSLEGGGEIAIDPRDLLGIKAFQSIFLFDIEMPIQKNAYNVGGRVYVRFDHGKEPIYLRWYRRTRQLLLRRFNV